MSEVLTAAQALSISEHINRERIESREIKAEQYFNAVMESVRRSAEAGSTWAALANGKFDSLPPMPPSVKKRLIDLGYTINPLTTVSGAGANETRYKTPDANISWHKNEKE